jgi:hypothetical protein
MDDDSSGEFEGEEPDESNNVSQVDEDEGSEDDRQRKRAKQDKATKKGPHLCITFSDVRLMLERQSRVTKGDYYQHFVIQPERDA